MASVLGVLGLVGYVGAILMLATQPTAARLDSEIGSLSNSVGERVGPTRWLQHRVDSNLRFSVRWSFAN